MFADSCKVSSDHELCIQMKCCIYNIEELSKEFHNMKIEVEETPKEIDNIRLALTEITNKLLSSN